MQEKKDVNLEMKENQPLLVLLQSEQPIKESHAAFFLLLALFSEWHISPCVSDCAHPGKVEKI